MSPTAETNSILPPHMIEINWCAFIFHEFCHSLNGFFALILMVIFLEKLVSLSWGIIHESHTKNVAKYFHWNEFENIRGKTIFNLDLDSVQSTTFSSNYYKEFTSFEMIKHRHFLGMSWVFLLNQREFKRKMYRE